MSQNIKERPIPSTSVSSGRANWGSLAPAYIDTENTDKV